MLCRAVFLVQVVVKDIGGDYRIYERTPKQVTATYKIFCSLWVELLLENCLMIDVSQSPFGFVATKSERRLDRHKSPWCYCCCSWKGS